MSAENTNEDGKEDGKKEDQDECHYAHRETHSKANHTGCRKYTKYTKQY